MEVEDGNDAGDATDKAVVAMMVTVLNGATMVWPLLRNFLSGDYVQYVELVKNVVFRYPVLAYNKGFGVGGWCGPKTPARTHNNVRSAQILRFVFLQHGGNQHYTRQPCVRVCVCVCVCVCTLRAMEIKASFFNHRLNFPVVRFFPVNHILF